MTSQSRAAHERTADGYDDVAATQLDVLVGPVGAREVDRMTVAVRLRHP